MTKPKKKSSSGGKSGKGSKPLKKAKSAKAVAKHDRKRNLAAEGSKTRKAKRKETSRIARLLEQQTELFRDHIRAALAGTETRLAEIIDEMRIKLERLDFAIVQVRNQLEKMQSAASPRPTSNRMPRQEPREQSRQKWPAKPDALRSPFGVLSEGLHTNPIDGDAGRVLSSSTLGQPGTKRRE